MDLFRDLQDKFGSLLDPELFTIIICIGLTSFFTDSPPDFSFENTFYIEDEDDNLADPEEPTEMAKADAFRPKGYDEYIGAKCKTDDPTP
jgi:hypothetical protein